MVRSLISGFVVVALLSGACGGRGGSVHVRWEAPDRSAALADDLSGTGATPVRTMVYVKNDSAGVVRAAVLSLSSSELESALGISLGTITNASTRFDGPARVWSLGDLTPGQSVGFPIGIWFSTSYREAAPDVVNLHVELSSPDLAVPITSNVLSLSLTK